MTSRSHDQGITLAGTHVTPLKLPNILIIAFAGFEAPPRVYINKEI